MPLFATRRRRRCVATLAAALAAAGLVGLAGCSATPAPARTSGTLPATAPSTAPSAMPTSTADAPAVLVPDGTAAENLPLFRAVTERVWAGPDRVTGRAYIDALVAAGFDKKAMQVTPDRSTVGNPAESIEFSVHWTDGQCLVGEVGPDVPAPATVVMPALGDGACLVGKTRDIDW